MTHATITAYDRICCCVAFAYDLATRNAVKELPGATYEDGAWIVPVMHLPILKLIFDSMDVAPEVVATYQALLKRMLCDTMTSTGRKGALGQHLAELHARHAHGIAHVMASGWQPTLTPRPHYVAPRTVAPAPGPVVEDAGLALWLRSGQGAVKAEERKEIVKRNVRRKKAAV